MSNSNLPIENNAEESKPSTDKSDLESGVFAKKLTGSMFNKYFKKPLANMGYHVPDEGTHKKVEDSSSNEKTE